MTTSKLVIGFIFVLNITFKWDLSKFFSFYDHDFWRVVEHKINAHRQLQQTSRLCFCLFDVINSISRCIAHPSVCESSNFVYLFDMNLGVYLSPLFVDLE